VLPNANGAELRTQNPTSHVPGPGTTVAIAGHATRVVVAWPVEGKELKLVSDALPVVDRKQISYPKVCGPPELKPSGACTAAVNL
jgi:hypothetical protein